MKTIALGSLLMEDVIFLDIEASNRMDVIRQIVSRLSENDAINDPEALVADAIKREEELATGLEHGIAMPHARTSAVRHIVCAFARLVEPLDFMSPDGSKSDLIFFSAVPSDGLDSYLHITAALVRRLSSEDVREQLRSVSTGEEVIELLAGER